MKNNFIKILFYSILIMFSSSALTGCASFAKKWKSLISGDEATPQAARAQSSAPRYSQQNNLIPSNYRQYKRTKRKDLEDNAHLDSKAGSLWVMEGQGAYLFSQNIVRMIGDPIAVRIEGDPQDQLASKAGVISKLLTQIEERRRRAQGRGPAAEDKKPEENAAPGAANAQAKGGPGPQTPGTGNTAENEPKDKKDFNVKMVPTRVVERLVDGNYRVRGVQPFMIGSREYKVIVSGIVRAEDFNEDGIAAPQLLDSSFDIVSSKNSEIN